MLNLENMNQTIYDVAIIGAGASGLVCAGECAKKGLSVLLLEKEQVVGRKILVTGNGRCNLTNKNVSPQFYHADTKLLETTFSQFSFDDALDYFNDLGVVTIEEDNGRFFPLTGKSTAVVEALKLAALEAGVTLQTSVEINKIKHHKTFVLHSKNGETFQSKKLVLACGSCAYPQVSGTTLGYELAKSLGHNINPPKPTLSAICIKETALTRLSGIRSQVTLSIWDENKKIAESSGELLFTNYGISGPTAINVSGSVSNLLSKGNVPLTINFLKDIHKPNEFIKKRLEKFSTRKPKDFFAGFLHENIANLLIDFIGLRKNISMGEQTPNTLARMENTLLNWPITATSLRSWNEAMVAMGGVKLQEINYNTFKSNKCSDLYVVGELLDVDGKSGGFNLHFAWASGIIAARHIAMEK